MVNLPAVKFPTSPFVDKSLNISREWRQWLLHPQFLSFTLEGVVGVESGGTGLGAIPGPGQLLIGTGTGYTLSTLSAGTSISIVNGAGSIQINVQNVDAGLITSGTLSALRLPAFSGDISTPSGSSVTTLAMVNGSPGSYGSASNVATYTVNAKGLVTASGNTPIAIPYTQVSGLGTAAVENYSIAAWAPTISFTTPGDLSVSYATQTGTITRIGRLTLIEFELIFTPTFTTSAGALIIDNVTNASTSAIHLGTLQWGAITKAGYTQINARLGAVSTTSMDFVASGSGVAASQVDFSNVVSGSPITLRGSMSYIV